MAKFKFGDRVKCNGRLCTVGLVHKDGFGGYLYGLTDDGGNKYKMPEKNIVLALNVQFNNTKPSTAVKHFDCGIEFIPIRLTIGKDGIVEWCPVCKNAYQTIDHPIHGARIKWSDCLTCNKTKEQIESERDKPISKEINSDNDDFGFHN